MIENFDILRILIKIAPLEILINTSNHMKKLYLILFLMCFCGSIMADQMLQIVKADGQTHTINLNQEPVTSYKDGNLVITTINATISYPLETVHKFVYISGSSDIQDIKGDRFEISRDGKFLTLSGLEKDTEAYLYSVNGMLMERIHVTASTSISINLESYPLGVYMIKVDGATYKILNQ